ncbi:hypothetical protein CYMTET_11031 [Cymbomonas tetramitiformis]|uniref:Uncharacterized protein n=1 Tax=Cymbomonas tetramitiformis TaxID=36881 RepID=A0AAE0GN32_9CHLO|nr:hypothetical protein CYMTET_11031 [Cymbomonas tetramitiformis]
MVSALQTTFVTEDIGFAPLFLLDDATLPIRVEANALLFSTLELMVDPASPAADWMGDGRVTGGISVLFGPTYSEHVKTRPYLAPSHCR